MVDPLPGPRTLAEVDNVRVLNDAVALCGPDATGPGGFRFAEARVAELLGHDTVLVDIHPGPAAVGAGLDAAARELGCDHVVLLDVGGDALAHGDEPGLGSPLADAMVLAAAPAIDLPVTGVIWGTGCDGELTVDEVMARIAEVWAAGGARGALALDSDRAERLERSVADVPTEASAMALRAARGQTGEAPIRGGRRTVTLTPVAGLFFLFDVEAALGSAARLADAVRDAPRLREANAILTRLGVRTELDYEIAMAQ